MRILAIETSCDDTAVSIVEASGGFENPSFSVRAEIISSQLALHAEWGGVVPNLAKREHQKALVPALLAALSNAKLSANKTAKTEPHTTEAIQKILAREPELLEPFLETVSRIEKPDIDLIAVTRGPGLEPALWVGINFAQALSEIWRIPVVAVNHMEGHFMSALLSQKKYAFPALALLVSGGHTELVLSRDWLSYEVVGETKDDAAGEAFDKVARILGLPYPGGPQISRLADEWVALGIQKKIALPRPMLKSNDSHFSFSGLKTAVLYTVQKMGELSLQDKQELAHEFQEAVLEVLLSKTKRVLENSGAHTLILGGGVSANKELRLRLAKLIETEFPETTLHLPQGKLSMDNATMIAMAGYFRALKNEPTLSPEKISAQGTWALD